MLAVRCERRNAQRLASTRVTGVAMDAGAAFIGWSACGGPGLDESGTGVRDRSHPGSGEEGFPRWAPGYFR